MQELETRRQIREFRGFAGNLLIAIDETEYSRSNKLHCPYCSSRKLKNGTTEYFQAVVTLVIVCPQMPQVLPLVPEFVQPQDGHDKQDCENAAAKRCLLENGKDYQNQPVTVLGDDLYCHQPLCQLLLQQSFNFILVCRPESYQITKERQQIEHAVWKLYRQGKQLQI